MIRVLIAPNAFKNSLDASAAALAIEKGFRMSSLDCFCQCFPIGDGGDGTGTLIVKELNGRIIPVQVRDPLGRLIESSFGLLEQDNTAVIDVSLASGLRLLRLEERNPLIASSFGTGELIKKTLDLGVDKIIIAAGGSATVDGGIGALKALGIRFLNKDGIELNGNPAGIKELHSIDTSNLDVRIKQCKITILCDVNNTLLGNNGSASVFGPQKGADPEAVVQLETSLSRFSSVVKQQFKMDLAAIQHGGTAGGLAVGLHALLNAELVNGAAYFLKLMNFNSALEQSDVVITGEGSIDDQTLMGKAPFCVAEEARKKGIPVIGLAGQIPNEPSEEIKRYFDALLSIGNGPADLDTAIKQTETNLTRIAAEVGNLLNIAALNLIK